jgi:Uma2 family endonuclease
MASPAGAPFLTPERYLELERAAEVRHEYVRGRMVAMAGGSLAHSRICLNAGLRFELMARPRGCRAFSADLRIFIAATGSYRFADLTVICGAPQMAGGNAEVITHPTVIVEVLSPTTEHADRNEKFAEYRTIPSLQEYVLISPSEPRIQLFRRGADAWTFHESYDLDDTLPLATLDARIPLRELYDGVDFEAANTVPAT